MSIVDTAIIGAGPAGSAAAYYLAAAGHDVLLIDKATFPRDKFCGDGLTTLALRELDAMDFDPSVIASFTPVDQAIIRSPNGREATIPLPEGPGLWAAIARRRELDAALVDHATAAGAKTALGHAVTAIDVGTDSVTLTLADESTVTANQCIAADGMWSPTRKMLGLPVAEGYRGEWHAFRQYFRNVGPQASKLWVWFEPDILPGYVWSFPVGDGVANVGFGILRGGEIPTQKMKTLWPEILQRPHIREVLGADAEPEDTHRAWPIPAHIDEAPLVGPRTLIIGDAATACDPLTGEGIGQAILTGREAAEALLGSASFTDAADRYSTVVRSELVADHKMATALGRILNNASFAEGVVRTIDLTPWTRRNFGRWLFEDYPRALIFTPRRWKKGMFTGPGAYENGLSNAKGV